VKRTFAIVLAALAAAALFRALVYAVLVAAHVSEPSRHHGLRPDAPATLGHRGRCGGTGRRGHRWAGSGHPLSNSACCCSGRETGSHVALETLQQLSVRPGEIMAEELPILDPTVRRLVDQLAADLKPPIYELKPGDARNSLLRAQSAPVQKLDAYVRDWNVDSAAGPLRLRTIRPVRADDQIPAILYFHGGGWVLGDARTHDRLVREIAVRAEATVVFVDFDRAPEFKYPVALEQAYAATVYVAEHGKAFGIDPSRLAVAGESSGGNMATVVALLAKQNSGPRIEGQLLFYPTTKADFETASYRQFADGPWLTRRAMQWFWDQYLPDHSKRESPHAAPLLASLDQLAGLPRTLIITAENDVLRDEGEAYGRRLIQAGVEVVTTRYNATIHDFVLLNALGNSAPTRAALTQAVDFLKNVLARKEAGQPDIR
jgi:acetyl esterase